jgi:WD40 repeat protein
MKKLLILLIQTLCILTVSFSQDQENKDVAVVKHSLPEFRDASIWKGRAGLTLFSPDGKYLAISGKTADVVIYETATGTIKTKIDGRGFTAFSFSPDSTFVVAQNSGNESLEVYETETGKKIRDIRGLDKLSNFKKDIGGSGPYGNAFGVYHYDSPEMESVPISPNWKSILINKNDKEYSLFDFTTGDFKYELEHENFSKSWETTKLIFLMLGNGGNLAGSISFAEFSADSKFVVIVNGNKKPTVWNVETGKLVSILETQYKVFNAKFSPNGKMISTSDLGGVTKIWDSETGNAISTFGSKKDRTLVTMWSRDSERVLSVSFTKKNDVRAIEVKSGKSQFIFDKSDSFQVFPSTEKMFIATIPKKDKTILFQIWETDTGKLIATVPRKKGENSLVSLKWSPDNQLIATTNGLRNDVQLWNLSGEHLQTLPNTTFPMKFSDDGKLLATGGRTADPKNDIGYIWDLKSKQ